jgi:putative hemin transport protein
MKANQHAESDRIRAAVERNPREMTLQLARDLGVPEVEVIRAFPSDRVTELDIARWEELFRSFEALGTVRVLVSNGATTIEVDGEFGGFSTAGEFFNVQTETLDMHIRWQQLAAAFAVEKPGHMDGTATRSFQFFDRLGAAALKVFFNFGGHRPKGKHRLSSCVRRSSGNPEHHRAVCWRGDRDGLFLLVLELCRRRYGNVDPHFLRVRRQA